jgi:hypothetical protein
MSRATLIALLLGLLLVAAPVARVYGEEDADYAEEDEDEAEAGGDDSEKDVVVLTTKNFDETIKKHKFVLASERACLPAPQLAQRGRCSSRGRTRCFVCDRRLNSTVRRELLAAHGRCFACKCPDLASMLCTDLARLLCPRFAPVLRIGADMQPPGAATAR